MGFNQRTNKDNVYVRSVIVGLINLLNNQIFYENVLDNNKSDIVEVSFFYSTTGDERFLQDYFMQWNDCIYPKKVDGNIDPIPRGVVKLSSMDIDTAGLTQRWIRGEFTKIINGKIETFSAYINSLPLKLSFDIEIQSDGMVEAFKIVQAVLETFYKVKIYNVDFRGFMIPCQVSFPEGYPVEKTLEFSYTSERMISINFNVEIESYYPVVDEPNLGSVNARDIANGDGNITTKRLSDVDFDSVLQRRRGMEYYEDHDNLSSKITSLRHASNKMDAIVIGKENDEASFDNYKHKGKIYLLSPKSGDIISSHNILEVNWRYTGWVDKINAYYSEDYGASWIEFLRLYDASKGKYEWKVPEFTKFIQGNIITEKNIEKQAEIKLIADVNGSIYDYVIVDPGQGYDDTAYIEIEEEGSGANISLDIKEGKITSLIIHDGGSGYLPTKETEIAIKIQSSADASIYDTTKDEFENIGVIIVK